MRRNLVVLGGVATVFLSGMFLPLLSITIDGVEKTLQSYMLVSIILLTLTIFFMLFRWAVRGVFWILLGLGGAIAVPSLMVSVNEVLIEVMASISPDAAPVYGRITYLPGMYVLILGYLIITGGGIWDIYQKRIPKPISTKTETVYSSQPKIQSSGKTQTLYFECNFLDDRREVVNFPKNNKVTIGSDSLVDIHTPPDKSADFQVLIKKGKTIYYIDVLDITFPTMLNGQIISKSRKLNDDDVIEVGDVSITVKIPS